jgi:predicted transcriptional regulator
LFSHIFRLAERWLITKPTEKIFAHIKQHPGIRYRQLLRLTGLANGVMSFHLKKLNKSKLVKTKNLGYNVSRYYPAYVETAESNILDHLLDPTRRKIIFILLEHSDRRLREIADYTNKARSTTWVHLQILERAGIISVIRVTRMNQSYRLKNKSRVIRTVKKYKINSKGNIDLRV